MTTLLNIRDNIRNFLVKYDNITTPIFKFIMAFALFYSLSTSFGYSSIFNKAIVIFVLSILCAFISSSVMLLLAGVVTCVHCFAVSWDLAALYAVIFILMYCLYIRFSSNCAYIIMFTPLLYMFKIHYILPIIVGIFVGPVGIVPAIFGVLFYYFSQYTSELSALLKTATEDDSIQGYSYIISGLIADKKMLLTMIVFAVVIIVTFIIYRLSVSHAWYIAIGVGGLLSIMLFLIGGFFLEADTDILTTIIGTLVGTVISFVIQFFKGVVDYSRAEVVQFEDEDYYYYVKAVPKIKVTAENVSVKKINTRN